MLFKIERHPLISQTLQSILGSRGPKWRHLGCLQSSIYSAITGDQASKLELILNAIEGMHSDDRIISTWNIIGASLILAKHLPMRQLDVQPIGVHTCAKYLTTPIDTRSELQRRFH